MYFLFQAEDGIRYLTVTGVQTCALPILFAYIVCVAGKSTDCVAFFATRREKQTGRYGDLGLRSVVCRRFNNPTRAAYSTKPARRFVRETERRDLRRPSGHPDRKSTRLNSSHSQISYAVFCLKKKNV